MLDRQSMLDRDEDYVSWAAVVQELDDTAEHLASLIEQLNQHGGVEHEDFGVQLAHIYGHLNRAWHQACPSDSEVREFSEEDFDSWSQFPSDLDPL